MESAVWGLIGTLVGATASIATTLITSRNALSLQNWASKLEREEQHRAFQRDTLVALQDALHDLLRLAARGHLEDEDSFKKTGTWAMQPLTEEVNEGLRLSRRNVLILTERISDDELRNEVKNLLEILTHILFARTPQDGESLFNIMLTDSTLVMEHIGQELRAQY